MKWKKKWKKEMEKETAKRQKKNEKKKSDVCETKNKGEIRFPLS